MALTTVFFLSLSLSLASAHAQQVTSSSTRRLAPLVIVSLFLRGLFSKKQTVNVQVEYYQASESAVWV